METAHRSFSSSMSSSSSDSGSSSNSGNRNNSNHQQQQKRQQKRQQNILQCSNTVRLCGTSSSPCGYCHGPSETSSYGLLFQENQLKPSTYEKLICRGWRRSGLHVYLPANETSCCPTLSIRLNVHKFCPSKSQRRVLQRMDKLTTKPQQSKQSKQSQSHSSPKTYAPMETDKEQLLLEWLQHYTTLALNNILGSTTTTINIPTVTYKMQPSSSFKHDQITNITTYKTTICAAIAGPSKGTIQRHLLASQVVHLLNQQLKSSPPTLQISGITSHDASGQIIVHTKSMASIIANNNNILHHQLQKQQQPSPMEITKTTTATTTTTTTLPLQITTMLATESALMPDVHRLYFDYQHKVHHDRHPLLHTNGNHDDNNIIDWGDATTEFQQAAIQMIQQQNYSKDILSSYTSFYRFLVESPLMTGTTLHQHYRLGSTLLAVGVLDVLPNGISSVYAFYDVSFQVPMGKYAILHEIEWTRTVLKKEFYYLGYYIETCSKMRYKLDYRPSELLCPTHYKWVDGAVGQAILQQTPRHYGTLYYTDDDKKDEDDPPEDDPDVIYNVSLAIPEIVTMSMLQPHGQELVRPHVQEFVHHVGADIAMECIIKLV